MVEPFAGGGIIGLTAAFEGLADHVVFTELDTQVGAVWQTILGGEAEWLAQRVLSFDLTWDNLKSVLDSTNGISVRDTAFRTILRNRTQHGGILAPGASFIKNGENGKGLRSRWYPETLAKRIREIDSIRTRFTFISGEGIEVIKEHRRQKSAAFFVDPPYTAGGLSGKRAGARLYTHFELNHERLFKVASKVAGDILLTYDDAPDVRALAEAHGLAFARVAMKNTHHAKLTELVIGRDLSWLGK